MDVSSMSFDPHADPDFDTFMKFCLENIIVHVIVGRILTIRYEIRTNSAPPSSFLLSPNTTWVG